MASMLSSTNRGRVFAMPCVGERRSAIYWTDISEDQTRSPSRYVCSTWGMYSPPSKTLPEYTTKSARRPGLQDAAQLFYQPAHGYCV